MTTRKPPSFAVVNIEVRRLCSQKGEKRSIPTICSGAGTGEDKKNYGLIVTVLGGGSLLIAAGTKRRMLELQGKARKKLTGNWALAKQVAMIIIDIQTW